MKKKVFLFWGIIVILIVILITVFCVYRRQQLVEGNWYQNIKVEGQKEYLHVVHYNGNEYYPIAKEDIPIDSGDQDWEYTHDVLMLDSHIKIIDYIPLFDYVKPSLSVLKNEKIGNDYVYISVLIGETRDYFKLSEEESQ